MTVRLGLKSIVFKMMTESKIINWTLGSRLVRILPLINTNKNIWTAEIPFNGPVVLIIIIGTSKIKLEIFIP